MRRQANKFGPGVSPSWDANDHVTTIDFSDKFSREMAETWLNEHDYHEFTIEDATIEEKSRTFGYPFTSLGGKFEHTPEGGLRVKGVKLLAAGTWTDSAQKTACEYSTDILKQFSGNWHDNAIWSRHFGGVPRNITEKVGIVENPRYENEAVVGDLYYHGLTGQSKDTIAMIENGLANYVSVETVSKDKWNVGKKVYQAQELGFTGLATVNQGACRVCKIRENENDMGRNGELEASVPSNPSGASIGENSTSCRLTLSDFTDKTWEELSSSEKSGIASHFAFNDGSDSFGALKLPHHDPKTGNIRPNCVRAALQAIGGARSGKPMELGGKETSVTSHLNSHLEDINSEKEAELMIREDSLSKKDSLEGIEIKIRDGLKTTVSSASEYGPYIIAVFPDQVVYEDDKTHNQYRIPYQIDGESVTFGTPVQVEVAYEDVEPETKRGAFEEIITMDEKELETLIESKIKAISDTSDAKIKELEEKLEASELQNKELAAKIDAIEKTPLPPKTSGADGEQKELEAGPIVNFDKKTGVISRRY